jgi:hypothetical protein
LLFGNVQQGLLTDDGATTATAAKIPASYV